MTADVPKPLLEVNGRPFVDYLVDDAVRFGFCEVLLLAGYRSEQIARYVETKRRRLPQGVSLDLVAEPVPLGTAGAVYHAADRLAERFLLLNGDSLFDANWLDLVPAMAASGSMIAMALHRSADTSRYGRVKVEGERVVSFAARGDETPGLINAGVYLVDRRIVLEFPAEGSLEQTVLPDLATRGLVSGRTYEGFFVDIGVPAALVQAQSTIPRQRQKTAVFFDRDGTLVVDHGYVHRPEHLVFQPGAVAAVKRVNDRGMYAFLATNQAGVAKGYFTEVDVQAFNSELQRRLRAAGAHLDDIRYCPYHPDGTAEPYRGSSDWRKPAPGMLLDLMRRWPVIKKSSVVVGDKEIDLHAADAAGLKGVLYQGGDLDTFLAPYLKFASGQPAAIVGSCDTLSQL